jgi:sec-independent protein translocase protein TatA
MIGIIVFIFGAKKIPELARGMGQGIKEFKKGLNEGEEEDPAAEGEEKANG